MGLSFRSGAKWIVARLHVFLWAVIVYLFARLIWRSVGDAVGTAWINVPPTKIGFISLGEWKLPPLPFFPTFLFAAAALLARPPRLKQPIDSWVFSLWFVPFREWKRNLRRGRLPFIDFGFRKVRMNWFRRGWRRWSLCWAVIWLFACAYDLPALKRQMLDGIDVKAKIAGVRDYRPPVSTRVYSEDGKEICRFTKEDRIQVPIAKIPLHVRQAFIAAEDQHFYDHDGIDPFAIIRAARENRQAGRMKQGGSTISQQVVKQVILNTSEKSVARKLTELFLVVELEKQVPKDQILEVYLNHIYLGRAYGVEAAAEAYFGKSVDQLTLAESAILAGMPTAPSKNSPSADFARAKARQAYVLGRMRDQKFITQTEMDAALREDVALVSRDASLNRMAAPYFCTLVQRQLESQFGEDAVFRKGLVVHTTLDMRMQMAAEASVRNGLLDLERDIGWTGPDDHDDAFTGACPSDGKAIVDEVVEFGTVVENGPKGVSVCIRGSRFAMHPDDVGRIRAWEGKSHRVLAVGDRMQVRVRSFQGPAAKNKPGPVLRYAITAKRTGGAKRGDALEAAMVVIDQKTGELKALVGGYDFDENQFDMATQAKRQAGSSIKPVFYTMALMHGMVVTDTMVDAQELACVDTASGRWCPRNYLGKHTNNQYMGTVDLRTALANSLNSISVQLVKKYGLDEAIRTMRKLGYTTPIPRVYPIAIGGADVTLWDHAYAYATLAANGRRMPHQFNQEQAGVTVLSVDDNEGKPLYRYVPGPPEQAIPAADAYAMDFLMRGVVEFGTGRRVKELGRPAGGKTGTTNDFKDAWYMGFTDDLTVGVWVGRQRPMPIGRDAHDERTGGSTALPFWLAFMKAAPLPPVAREFPVPSDIVFATDGDGKIIPFQRGRVPARYIASH